MENSLYYINTVLGEETLIVPEPYVILIIHLELKIRYTFEVSGHELWGKTFTLLEFSA